MTGVRMRGMEHLCEFIWHEDTSIYPTTLQFLKSGDRREASKTPKLSFNSCTRLTTLSPWLSSGAVTVADPIFRHNRLKILYYNSVV